MLGSLLSLGLLLSPVFRSKKSDSSTVGPTKSDKALLTPVEPQHRDVISARCSTEPKPEALSECNREIRTLRVSKNLYNIQKVYELLDHAFFDGRITQIARIKECRSKITAASEIGSLIEYDGRGDIIICLPPRGEKSAQDTINILLREMACIHFWKVYTCCCQGCRCSKGALRVCDFIGYLSKLNAAVNFHLKGFPNQWRIESGDFLILKDIIKILQGPKPVNREFAFAFEIAKATSEVTLPVEEPMEKQRTASEITSMVEQPLEVEDTASEETVLIEEPPEMQDTASEDTLVEEPSESQNTAPEDSLLVEEPLEKQEDCAAILET